MNGAEHYQMAETLIDSCRHYTTTTDDQGREVEVYGATPDTDGIDATRDTLAAAQVHATLALAAATVGLRGFDPALPEFGDSDADRRFYEVTQ